MSSGIIICGTVSPYVAWTVVSQCILTSICSKSFVG